jgi:hypothetical protein
MSADSLLDLHDRLRKDDGRDIRPLSADMVDFGLLMHKPFAEEHEVIEALNRWCATRQPCQFGKVAAKKGQIFFCYLAERDLADGDQAVRAKIAAAKKHWKQRAVKDTERPPHSFVLVCGSRRLELAAPDDNLRRFSKRLLELTGWKPERHAARGENAITSDYLYMKNPQTGAYHGFRFNIDFFAAAGDGTWWHDHRFPGGMAFTANAAGHMKCFIDWYGDPGRDHGGWALTQAMMTIAKGHPTKGVNEGAAPTEQTARDEGRVTWLLDLKKGKPFVERLGCPLDPVPKQFAGKDWTKYEGLLHTDHSVREEFFGGRSDPATKHKVPLLDFTYLYDAAQADFAEFMAGQIFSEDQVFADIDTPENWAHRDGEFRPIERTDAEAAEVAELLSRCLAWEEIEG